MITMIGIMLPCYFTPASLILDIHCSIVTMSYFLVIYFCMCIFLLSFKLLLLRAKLIVSVLLHSLLVHLRYGFTVYIEVDTICTVTAIL